MPPGTRRTAGAGVRAGVRARARLARERRARRVHAERRWYAVLLVACLLVLAGCRDGAAPFDAQDRSAAATGPVWQLTYSPGDDRAPTWSASGDSVLYTAEGFHHLPASNGVLASIPGDGGAASALLPSVQTRTGTSYWLMAPAVAPGGARVAFAHIRLFRMRDVCLIGSGGVTRVCAPHDWEPTVPRLASAAVRVRAFAADHRLAEDPELRIVLPDTQIIPNDTLPPAFPRQVEFVRYDPFRVVFSAEGTLLFRPSWAPDGERVVYSDGLRLRIWRVGDDADTVVPGTADGVSAAWSPHGEWIAFSALERADSVFTRCAVYADGLPFCTGDQVVYRVGRRVLTIVRPDGTGRTELTEGEEPAWAPDGRTLFFRNDGRIWRIGIDGAGLAPVEHTADGREPAVSPDGRRLAFARRTDRGDHDVWIVSLDAS